MFKFSIRDILWLTLVVGLALGWWVEHRQHARDAVDLHVLRALNRAYMDRAGQLLEGVKRLEQEAAEREKSVEQSQGSALNEPPRPHGSD